MKPHRGGYFVELGAFDGIKQSNSIYLELFLGFRGALIEAEPSNYNLLTRNRNGLTNSLIHAACVSPDYSGETVEIVSAGARSGLLGVATELENPVAHATKYLEKRSSPAIVRTPARTLTDVLSTIGAPNFIDILILDVEGVEASVVEGLDESFFRARFLVVESRQITALKSLLEKKGYIFVRQLTVRDFLFRAV